jgi:hypothetical protein
MISRWFFYLSIFVGTTIWIKAQFVDDNGGICLSRRREELESTICGGLWSVGLNGNTSSVLRHGGRRRVQILRGFWSDIEL